jgi:hypothetical protein
MGPPHSKILGKDYGMMRRESVLECGGPDMPLSRLRLKNRPLLGPCCSLLQFGFRQ